MKWKKRLPSVLQDTCKIRMKVMKFFSYRITNSSKVKIKHISIVMEKRYL